MSAGVVVRRIICRGNDLYPQAWEVWGTARQCRSVDVRFVRPGEPGESPSVISKTVTVILPTNATPRTEVQTQRYEDDLPRAEGEALWCARFYAYEHLELGWVRPWLRADPARAVEIEATAAAWSATDPAVTATQAFMDADILAGYEFEAGVLLVHGIGAHSQGETFVHFSEPVIALLQRWVRGVSDRWIHAYSGHDAAAWRDMVVATTLRHQQDLFDLTDEVDRFADRTAATTPDLDRTVLEQQMGPTFSQFLVGDVCVVDTALRPLASEPDVAGITSLRLSALDRNGALQQTHVAITEAWWTDEVALPSTAQLREWIFDASPWVIAAWVTTAIRKTSGGGPAPPLTASGRWVRRFDALITEFLLPPLALVFCVAVQVLLWLLSLAAQIPSSWVKAVVNPLIAVLLGTTGQSYAMVTSELRRSAIVSKVRRQLHTLCDRCRHVIVLAHSQGAEVSRYVIGSRMRKEVARCTTFGSGVKMLGILMMAPSRRARSFAAWALIGCLVGVTVTFAKSGVSAWWSALFTYAALFGFASWFFERPQYNQTFRKSVPLVDYYASRDPVPCGKLSDNAALLHEIDFKLVEVHNTGSVLLDHTSYFENVEEFVAPVAFDIAALAGLPLGDLMREDAVRRAEAKTRRHALVERRQFLARAWLVAMAAAAWLAMAAQPGPWPASVTAAVNGWPGVSWRAWSEVLGRGPALAWAALPMLLAIAICGIERLLLNREFGRSVDALLSRQARPGGWRPAAVRLGTYLAGAAGLAIWAVLHFR